MIKKIMPFALALFSAIFVSSCSSSDSDGDSGNNNDYNKVVNEAVLAKMEANYYWSVPTTVNNTLDPKSYFAGLLNVNDKYTIGGKESRYSSLYSANELSSNTASYDIGFEYGANLYLDGNLYYTIYYVKPGTDAAQQGLVRGLLIRSVNGVAVTSANKDYLLSQAYRNGQSVDLDILKPVTGSNNLTFKIKPVLDYVEDPIFLSSLLTNGVEQDKVGYIVYNAFTSGKDNVYDNKLASELQRYAALGVEYLILDLRYNANGLPASAQKLASAVVNNVSETAPFIYMKGREDKGNTPYNFISTSGSLLASKLKKVYVIVGVNTGGISEAFVNGLKAYLGTGVVIVGETTQGRNMTTGSTYLDDKSYLINMVIGEWTNKDLKSYSKISPDNGFTVVEPGILEPLSSSSEAALARIIADINGSGSTRSIDANAPQALGSSIQRKAIDPILNSIEIQ